MRKQDHLLQLIATLSPAEKRNFKIFSNAQPGDKGYIRLFDALENKLTYDAKALCKELSLNEKQLKNYKYYLNRNLLRSLENSAEPSEKMLLARGYLEALVLTNRRQYNYALEVTEKLIERAVQLNTYQFLPNLIALKQTCLYQLERDDEIPALTEKLRAHNLANDELFEIMQLMYAVTGMERARKDPEAMRALFEHPILKKKVTDLKSLKAQVAWFDIMTRYTMFYDTPEAFLKLMKDEVALYEKNQEVKVVDPMSYVHSYAKVGRAFMKTGKAADALPWLEKFNALLEKPPAGITSEKVKALKAYGCYNTSMALRALGRFSEAFPLAEKSVRELGEGYPYLRYSYLFEKALVLFHNGRIKEADTILNELLQLNTEMRSDLQLLVRPLMILIQFELGNKSVVTYMIKAAKAWLKRTKQSSKECDTFFSFIYAMAKAGRTALQQLLSEFKEEVATNRLGYLGDNNNLHLALWIDRQLAKNKRG